MSFIHLTNLIIIIKCNYELWTTIEKIEAKYSNKAD